MAPLLSPNSLQAVPKLFIALTFFGWIFIALRSNCFALSKLLFIADSVANKEIESK